MSLARLAAEALFAPPAPVDGGAPQPLTAEPPPDLSADHRLALSRGRSSVPPPARSPRVFRLVTADGASAPPEASAPEPRADAPAVDVSAHTPPAPLRAAGKRSADRRPGPGRVIYAAPRSERTELAAAARARPTPPGRPANPATVADPGERILAGLDAALAHSRLGACRRVDEQLNALRRLVDDLRMPRPI